MLRTICLTSAVVGASAGSIELVSGSLGKGGLSLDNIKGKWSQALKVFGKDATVSAEYDRDQNKDFLNEVSLSGDSGDLSYKLTSGFGSSVDYEVGTTTSDGTKLEAEGSFDGLSSGLSLSKVTATRAVKVRDNDCELALSHNLGSSESKVTLSSVLGSGLKAVGMLTSKDGSGSTSYEVSYDTTLSEGRTLSATVSPSDGTGEVEYEDSATLGATLNAKFPLGGSPLVTIKRSFGF